MKILVTGATGQVGEALLSSMAPLGKVEAACRSGVRPDGVAAHALDLADLHGLVALLDQVMPDVVVNAAAYTAVDKAEQEESVATAINGIAPGVLARWCAAHGALLVHYSTDYVFPGNATQPYREDDPTGPVGAYGRSKLAGEQAVLTSGCQAIVLRTAWVYGPRGGNFLLNMLRLGEARDQLAVVSDQRGAPTTARLIANATAGAVAKWYDALPTSRETLTGLFHLVASGQATWHSFAKAIFSGAVDRGLLARAPRVDAISTEQYPTPARRPAFSVLDNRRFAEAFDIHLPEWQAGLDDTLDALRATRP